VSWTTTGGLAPQEWPRAEEPSPAPEPLAAGAVGSPAEALAAEEPEAAAEEPEAAADEPGPAEEPIEEPMPARRLQLYLLRHADAGDPAAWRRPDAERPLSKKGRRQAQWVGRWLQGQRRLPAIVLTSPKVRALETARLATEGSGIKPVIDDRLAGGADLEELAAIIEDRASDASRVLLVGHDPDFSSIASDLVGGSIEIKKGGIARIDLTGPIAADAGTLRWLVPPEAVTED
jgi:phosphohistidine phosphatase